MPAFATSADGARIAYEVHGAGSPALLFVHGWSCNRGYWSAQAGSLSRDALVIFVDLAGHGDSDANRTDWTMASFGADVGAVIDALALDDVVLVGHSMGADVVLEAARLRIGRVRGQVWVDEYNQLERFRDEQEIRDRVEAFRADFAGATRGFVRRLFSPNADPALVERVSLAMASADPAIALACLAATWNHGREVPALLAEVGMPVVAINAASAHTDRASLQRHGIDLIEMPDVGHFPIGGPGRIRSVSSPGMRQSRQKTALTRRIR